MSGDEQGGGGGAGAARLDVLSRELVVAQSGGDHLKASKLGREREALAEQLYGTEPVKHSVRDVGAPGKDANLHLADSVEAYRGPVEHVPPAEPGTTEAFAENLHALGEEGSAIVEDWGGPESQNFAQNAGYLRSAVEYVARDDPGIVELLDAEIEDENGRVSRLGNHPALIKAAALFGRLLAHRSGLEIDALRSSAKRAAISGAAASSGGGDMDGLTRAMLEAHQKGDSTTVNRLNRQIAALARSRFGDTPVDGRTR